MFQKLKAKKDFKKLMALYESFHADFYEPDPSLVPPELVVRSILQMSEESQIDSRGGPTLVPYVIEAIAELPPMAMGLGIWLKTEQICLAYSERPRILYADYNKISRMGQIYQHFLDKAKESGSWRHLVELVWYGGGRLMKVYFHASDVTSDVFEK